MAKRKASAVSPVKSTSAANTAAPTPSRTRAVKKTRFSGSSIPTNTSTRSAATSTGLTPAVQKAVLSTPRRRASTPANLGHVPSSSPATSELEYAQFTPLRQVLDERCKRRIRRNGLSDVVNEYQSEKRENSQLRHEIRCKDQELKQMQQELEAAKRQPQTVEQAVQTVAVQSRVDEAEEELSRLRRSFAIEPQELHDGWDHVPRRTGGPRSVGGDTIPIFEDDADPYPTGSLPPPVPVQDRVDATLMSLELASARQAKQDMLNSFSRNSRSFDTTADLLDFADSPSKAADGPHHQSSISSRVHAQEIRKQLALAKSRADDAELALSALEGEVRALGFSQAEDAPASACLTALADHFRAIRLDLEHLMPGETAMSFDNNSALLPELVKKLKQLVQQLAARDGELQRLRSQEKSLRGNFDHAIVAAGKAQGKVKELEKSIDDAAEETLHMRMKSQRLERDLDERQSDVQKLQAALDKYREEVQRLEALISQVEDDHKKAMATVQASAQSWETTAQHWETTAGDMGAKAAAETVGRRKAEESAVSRLAKIQDLESALNKAKEQAEETAERLQAVEEKSMRQREEVGRLNVRNSNLSTALTSAEAEIAKLTAINEKLEERYRTEVESGCQTVEKIQHELIRAATRITEQGKGYRRSTKVRLANWELESDDYPVGEDGLPMTPASTVSPTSEHLPGSVEVRRGRKRQQLTPAVGFRKRGRRSYDSGVGIDSCGDESEAEVDDSGLASPELSSDADVDMSVGLVFFIMAVREADHAGSWYSDDGRQLASSLDAWLAQVPDDLGSGSGQVPVRGARAIIAPHAGYAYSGPAAAWAYKSLDLSGVRFTHMSQAIDEAEHSAEMQLPYLHRLLQQLYPDRTTAAYPPLVPIMVGATSTATEVALGKLLAPYVADAESNAFVISSDFCHWGSRFQYTYYVADAPSPAVDARVLPNNSNEQSQSSPDLHKRLSPGTQLRKTPGPGQPQIYESIAHVDRACMCAIATGAHTEFVDVLRATGNTVCGRHPIGVFMAAVEEEEEEKDGIFHFIRYERSSDCTSVRDSSVSYVSAYALL
ncbi:hypothetical protein DV737_g5057, partial [Chaetothyriales sp. CBS 132003]